MDSILTPTGNEFQFLVAEVKTSTVGIDTENVTSCLPVEALLLKNSQKILPNKLKNRSSTVTEVPEEEIQGNPIGMLQELCMMRRWMPPDYSTEQEEGLPHERLFTILCTVGNFKEYGVGRSKKLAKRQSAHKMVQKILMIPVEDESNLRSLEDDDEIVDRFVTQKGNRSAAANSGISRRISLFHKNLKILTGTRLEKLKLTDPDQLHKIDAVRWLKELTLENRLDITYVNIEEKSKSDKYQCLVQLSTVPVAVCYGTADVAEHAKKQAAINGLKYIQLLSK